MPSTIHRITNVRTSKCPAASRQGSPSSDSLTFRLFDVCHALLIASALVLLLGCADRIARAQVVQGHAEAAGYVDLPRCPAISPDGSQITFTWRGDIWKVSAAGGRAVRLTSHPADDLCSAWSPCGTRIAFNSARDGYLNIYLMNENGTDIRQLTNIDRWCTLAGFGVDDDGEDVVTFHAHLEGDVYRSERPYMVSVSGGDLRRIHDAFGGSPVISPDGSRVLFTRGGSYDGWNRRHYRGSESQNIWVFDRADDSFRQLTFRRGHDGKPQWETDAEGAATMLYLSDRELNTVNLYRMDIAEGEDAAARLTSFEGRDVQEFSIARDGSIAVLMVWDTLYTLDLADAAANPVPLVISASEDDRDNYEWKPINREVSEAALSPDGKVMAFISYGRVYVRNVEEKSPTRRVGGNTHARHRDIAWSPDGVYLYFVNDEDGTDSIYRATVAMTRSEVKESFDAALQPVPENDLDAVDVEDEAVGVEDDVENERADSDQESQRQLQQQPDTPEREGGDDESDNAEPDSEAEPETPNLAVRWHDALTFNIVPIIQTAENDRAPSPSPDGGSIAFRRGRGDLMIYDIATDEIERLVEGWDTSIHWRWSPDAAHIAYAQNDLNFSTDIHIVPVDGSADPINVTRHPRNDLNPRWSHDGRILSFISNRVGNEYDLWMVYLDKSLEALTPKELDEYYAEAARRARDLKPLGRPTSERDRRTDRRRDSDADDEANGGDNGEGEDDREDEDTRTTRRDDHPIYDQPVQVHLDDAYLRLERITRHGSVGGNEMTPAGDRYIYLATIGDSRSLYSIKWDGTGEQRIAGNVSVQHLSLTGDKAIFVSGGRGGTTSVSSSGEEYIDISDRLRIDLQEQSSQKFLEAARFIGENFYHNTLKDLDWETLTRDYHALARQTRTANEFNHVSSRFLGELNGSHLGIRASEPDPPAQQPHGRLGTVHHRVTLDDGSHGFAVTEVVPRSPAAISPMRLQPGDVITAIDLQPFGPADTIEGALQGRIGEEVIVTIQRTLDEGRVVELHSLLTPIGFRAEAQLKYDAWVERNRALIDEWSGGRVGYIHIQGMNQPSLDRYERDLNAAAGGKDGLIIDVRNNGGGWTTDRLLASIMVQPHAYTVPRGSDAEQAQRIRAYPQDRLFIQRYTQPINMLCNEKSFSNAEIISHAFKTLGRGTLVGQETYGGVISTGGIRLIDGTFVRNPFRGWFLFDGADMEERGAVPDTIVPQTPEAEVRGEDAQLREAMEDLLKRLD